MLTVHLRYGMYDNNFIISHFLKHFRLIQHCFLVPGPPYFFMSLQFEHPLQSSLLHAPHSPHLLLRPVHNSRELSVIKFQKYMLYACSLIPRPSHFQCWMYCITKGGLGMRLIICMHNVIDSFQLC